MPNRREVVAGTASLVSTVSLTGCSSTDQPENDQVDTQNQSQEQEEDQEESTQAQELSNFEINSIEFSYTISSGLSSNIRATNTTEQGTDPNDVNISIVAYDENEAVGSDNQWETVPATYHQDFELEVPDVAETSDTTIDDVSELVVRGKERSEEYTNLRAISGDELRNRVDK